MAALRERAGPNENRGETAAIAGVSLVVRGRGVNAGPGTPHPEERRRRVSKGAAFAANIRGVLGWGGLIWRELHDSMKMHLAIERLVEDGDTVVALLNGRAGSVRRFVGFRTKHRRERLTRSSPSSGSNLTAAKSRGAGRRGTRPRSRGRCASRRATTRVIARSDSDEAIQGQILQRIEHLPWIASLRSQ